MLHIAIVESEAVAKDLVFEIGRILHDYAWNFTFLTSIMDFFKEQQKSSFDIVVLDEKYQTKRIYESLIKDHPYPVIFICEKAPKDYPIHHVYYLERNHFDIKKLDSVVKAVAKRQEDFFFSYNEVKVMMKIDDIRYIEKQDKYLIYHTTKGEFRERGNMMDVIKRLQDYDFLQTHVSYLINEHYIKEIEGYEVILKDKTRLPISRNKSPIIKKYLQKKWKYTY